MSLSGNDSTRHLSGRRPRAATMHRGGPASSPSSADADTLVSEREASAALRQSEQQYRLLFEDNPNPMWVYDEDDLSFLAVNEAAIRHYGYSREEFLAMTLKDIRPADDVPALLVAVPQQRGQVAMHNGVWRHHKKDGTLMDIEITSSTVAFCGMTARLVLAHDVTAHLLVERELQRAKVAAEVANVAKGRFLANVSHDLRTPMNAILGMTELALAEQLSPTVRENLETVKESADVLLELLNEILDLSRMEAGKFQLETAPFDLRRAVERTLKALEASARDKGLSLACDVPDDVPDRLVGDCLRLRQVLMNLIGNAIKFTERGEIVVTIGIDAQSPEGVSLEFVVTDTGIGISNEDRARIFSPFVQVDPAATQRLGGTGLGLAISSHIVSLMGGRIWVESEVGRGSTFHFTAGFTLAGDAIVHLDTGRNSCVKTGAVAASRLRVLLAEDTRANQKLVVRILEKRGHIVDIAQDGCQALRLLQEKPFDVVLMDVQMPVMDGFEATAAIRALPKPGCATLPIIAMTACAMKGDLERCLTAGMDAYLAKPIDSRELIEAVEGLARKPSAAE
jgi:PAS domain S-box-containing protein